MDQLTLQSRIEGGLLGLLVGDALGVPYEFHPPEGLPPVEAIEFQPPPGFRRAHYGVPPGTWSDDGAQALILLDSLLAKDGLDLGHFAEGLRNWLLTGFYAVNRSVFDIGMQTSTAINRLSSGISPDVAGPSAEQHNGNGSLMRVLPLVLWHQGSDANLVYVAMRQSLPTHGHWQSKITCAMYCLWARRWLEGATSPWASAESGVREILGGDAPADQLDHVLDPDNADRARGTGYVVDTLWSAKHAIESTCDYKACVRRAIAFGHDTDTTATVAGGIAGIRYGVDDIPVRWRTRFADATYTYPWLGSCWPDFELMPPTSRRPMRIAEARVCQQPNTTRETTRAHVLFTSRNRSDRP